MTVERKRCPRCERRRPVNAFGLDRTRKDGLQFYCYTCKRELNRAVNAKRRHKIRAWEQEHAQPCVDCERPTSFNGSEPHLRCHECSNRHLRARRLARAEEMLALRKEGLLNYEIGERLGISAEGVANALQRRRLKELGLKFARSPYRGVVEWDRRAA